MSELRVNPSEVHQSGVAIGEIAATAKSALGRSDAEIVSAQSGWVGNSAAALAELTSEWQQSTPVLAEILADHGAKFTAAAEQYGQADESGADSVRSAAENL
jgi:WXG100 family type VII secretion target